MADLVILEYGVGNLGSIVNACRRAGCEPKIVSNPAELKAINPSHIVLPGVGAIGEALSNLRDRGLEAPLTELARTKKIPTLAICVGMQMLAETCHEFDDYSGLSWLPDASTRRIAKKGSGIRLPHMGWNEITVCGDHGGLLDGLENEHFYFLHSYAMSLPNTQLIATTEYHNPITAAVRNNNIYGVQFHPEKSNKAGACLMSNFLALGG